MARWIKMIALDSSCVAAAGYDARSATLRLRYVEGECYDYRDVPPALFDALLDAPSKGRFVNAHIKPHYAYVHLT